METLTPKSLAPAAPAGALVAESPVFAVNYNGKTMTDDLMSSLLSITYIDNTEGESDELTIVLDDAFGKWRTQWRPEHGATMNARLGWQNRTITAGEMAVDEVEASGAPHQITIRAVAAMFTKATRTKRSKAHEAQTLSQIAEKVAAAYGFTVVGTIRPVTIARATQHREHDLKFLKRLALNYGYVFTVRGKQLIFSDALTLERKRSAVTLDLSELSNYTLRDKVSETFANVVVKHHDPKSKKVLKAKSAAPSGVTTSADTLVVHRRLESTEQAEKQAAAALHHYNSRATEGTFSLDGRPELVAGVCVDLTGLGYYDGTYFILKSTHKIDRSGYTTDVEVKRIG